MPKLVCPCGYVHNLSPIPNDGWVTIRDREFEQTVENDRIVDELVDTILEQADDSEDWRRYGAAFWAGVRARRLLFECPECGRLMWEQTDKDGFEISYRVYKPEGIDEATQGDLWIRESEEPEVSETGNDRTGDTGT
jgi:hypothetical protein